MRKSVEMNSFEAAKQKVKQSITLSELEVAKQVINSLAKSITTREEELLYYNCMYEYFSKHKELSSRK